MKDSMCISAVVKGLPIEEALLGFPRSFFKMGWGPSCFCWLSFWSGHSCVFLFAAAARLQLALQSIFPASSNRAAAASRLEVNKAMTNLEASSWRQSDSYMSLFYKP